MNEEFDLWSSVYSKNRYHVVINKNIVCTQATCLSDGQIALNHVYLFHLRCVTVSVHSWSFEDRGIAIDGSNFAFSVSPLSTLHYEWELTLVCSESESNIRVERHEYFQEFRLLVWHKLGIVIILPKCDLFSSGNHYKQVHMPQIKGDTMSIYVPPLDELCM